LGPASIDKLLLAGLGLLLGVEQKVQEDRLVKLIKSLVRAAASVFGEKTEERPDGLTTI
jgi:hypothetical protein